MKSLWGRHPMYLEKQLAPPAHRANRYVKHMVPNRGSRVDRSRHDPARKEGKGEPTVAHKQAVAACGHDPYAES